MPSRTMISPPQLRSTCRSESPASVVDETPKSRKRWLHHSDDHHDRSAYLPVIDLNKTTKKRVRFQAARSLEAYAEECSRSFPLSSSGDDTYSGLCWSRAEIKSFHRRARQEARAFTTESPSCPLDIAAAFQECLEKKQVSPQIVQRLCSSVNCRYLRGLEAQAVPLLRKQRMFHIRSLLSIQERCRDQDPKTREHILKTRSVQTSRAFRSMSRILAAMDSYEVAAMVREELLDQGASARIF